MMKPLCLSIAGAVLFAAAAPGQQGWLDRFPYAYTSGMVSVRSDISPEFSKSHGEHAVKTWNYLSSLFKKSPGSRIELYYTKDEELFGKILKVHPAIVIKGARMIATHWAYDHRKWYIVPYTVPDYGTQLHELSHDFFYSTYPRLEESPWLKEGSGMYFESGAFDKDGTFAVTAPFPSFHALFKNWHEKKGLCSLPQLLSMKGAAFYAADFTKTYPQAMMFFFYLMEKEPQVMKLFFAKLNGGKFDGNKSVVDFIVLETKKTVSQLDAEYLQYALER